MDLEDFNENQKKVLGYGEGPLLVEAGPGSGKTTVIIKKIECLIEKGIRPETFLVITFTRKAADNLKAKLRDSDVVTDDDISKMQISTIHSFCLDYLKSKEVFLNLLNDDESEKNELFIQKFKERLGFVGLYTILDYQFSDVIDKFSEYTSFKVKKEDLIKYFEETKQPSQEYIDLVNSMDYFTKQRIDDNELKDEWYNARCIQIARAYPIYMELLDEFNYVDYDTLQLKTLEKLEEDPITGYTTIFVDEFQDTDPLQCRIFKILQENSRYFTAVGDVDQHIYAFRSSFDDYFREMKEFCDAEIISLDVNYRSTENIVRLTDDFIKDQRKEYSQKHLESDNKKYNNPNFIIRSKNNDEEADKIYNIIKHLKDEYGLKDSDIAVLYRTNFNKTIPKLIEKLNDDCIDFSIRGQKDLSNQDEVKSIITLLWYITRKTNPGRILSKDELKELNLKAFCGDYFEPAFWSLAEDTKFYLRELQDSFYNKIIEIENRIRNDRGDGTVSAVHNIKKNETMDTLIDIFSQVEIPVIDIEKINDENDRRFFMDLAELRKEIEGEEPPSILNVYYRLISMGSIFENIENNVSQAMNLARITETIYNYESFISGTDVRGLFYFLNRAVGNYSSYYDEDSGIQLMTVHSAKGLEFTVVIVASLENEKFPMALKDPEREKNFVYPSYTHYTPTELLEYKKEAFDKQNTDNRSLIEFENQLDLEEEDRILYVAMTRAADLLILSTLKKEPEQIAKIMPHLKELDIEDLDNLTLKKSFKHGDDEKLKLNFSSYSTYESCPFKYNLGYNFGFRRSPQRAANRGTVFHEIMETVNLKFINDEEISIKELESITDEVYKSMFDMDDDQGEFEEFKEKVKEYHLKFSIEREVLESELPFEIDFGEFVLNGAIDLIYKINDDEIVILDYKYAEHDDDKIEHYTEQLYIYALALSQIPEFKDYKIKKAITHFVLTDHQHEVDIDDEVLDEQLNRLYDIACEINSPSCSYPKKTGSCGRCSYRTICQGIIE